MNLPEKWDLFGLALVCRNDCIADSAGNMPAGLQDARRGKAFQKQLDGCEALIMGRHAHATMPSTHDRVRVIMTREVQALEHKEGGWWWGPDAMSLENMLRMVAPSGGRVAVRGGRESFNYFLRNGLQTLRICRAESIAIMDGFKLFAECDRKTTLDDVLRAKGLVLQDRRLIDLKAPISLSTWTRA